MVEEGKCLAGWAINHSPQGRPWPELRVWPSSSAPHTSIASLVYGHQWRTSNEWNIIFHIIFQPLTLVPAHKISLFFFFFFDSKMYECYRIKLQTVSTPPSDEVHLSISFYFIYTFIHRPGCAKYINTYIKQCFLWALNTSMDGFCRDWLFSRQLNFQRKILPIKPT